MYEIKLRLIIRNSLGFIRLLEMPRKYVRVTGNTRCTRVYSKQPKWSVGTITGPSNSPPQRNTQIINVPIVSCPSIFKFHRLSPDPTTMYPPKIYKNFTIFAFQKKKKKKKTSSKVSYTFGPRNWHTSWPSIYIHHDRYQKINSTGTNNPRPSHKRI